MENILEEKEGKSAEKEKMILVNEEKLRDLLEKNIVISEEILKTSLYIKKYIFWQRVFSFIKIIIIAIPIILAILYLIPFLGSFLDFLKNGFDIISEGELL